MISLSLGYVLVYVVLVGVASFVESPVGRGFGAFQLNALIRTGSLAAAAIALVATHGFTLPATRSALAGLGIGLLTGVGSLFYCFALDYLPVSSVVTFSNLYVAITTLLGIVALGESVTALKITGAHLHRSRRRVARPSPARYGVNPDASPARIHPQSARS